MSFEEGDDEEEEESCCPRWRQLSGDKMVAEMESGAGSSLLGLLLRLLCDDSCVCFALGGRCVGLKGLEFVGYLVDEIANINVHRDGRGCPPLTDSMSWASSPVATAKLSEAALPGGEDVGDRLLRVGVAGCLMLFERLSDFTWRGHVVGDVGDTAFRWERRIWCRRFRIWNRCRRSRIWNRVRIRLARRCGRSWLTRTVIVVARRNGLGTLAGPVSLLLR